MFDRSGWEPCVGELVRVRQWDDMVAEFGVDDGGDIPCENYFTVSMKHLCGEEFVVKEITEYGSVKGHNFGYNISADMLEPVCFELSDQVENAGEEIMVFLGAFAIC